MMQLLFSKMSLLDSLWLGEEGFGAITNPLLRGIAILRGPNPLYIFGISPLGIFGGFSLFLKSGFTPSATIGLAVVDIVGLIADAIWYFFKK